MNPAVFAEFQQLIHRTAGIRLGPDKTSLLSTRLSKRMRHLGLQDYREYFDIVNGGNRGELTELIDAISTNVTSFFRESRHFDILNEHLSQLAKQGKRSFSLWTAASSTGEEPYSMAITAREALGPSADIRILATDINTKVLQACSEGIYAARLVESVPAQLRSKYFKKLSDDRYQAVEDLRRLLTVRRLNLTHIPFPMRGPFDAIFCRNVMIYFDDHLRKSLVGEMRRLIGKSGVLFVGHSETLAGARDDLHTVAPAAYRAK